MGSSMKPSLFQCDLFSQRISDLFCEFSIIWVVHKYEVVSFKVTAVLIILVAF